ncbi:MAG: hypothetical protein ACYSR0_07980, partial [Planctomycetota bacterium]
AEYEKLIKMKVELSQMENMKTIKVLEAKISESKALTEKELKMAEKQEKALRIKQEKLQEATDELEERWERRMLSVFTFTGYVTGYLPKKQLETILNNLGPDIAKDIRDMIAEVDEKTERKNLPEK